MQSKTPANEGASNGSEEEVTSIEATESTLNADDILKRKLDFQGQAVKVVSFKDSRLPTDKLFFWVGEGTAPLAQALSSNNTEENPVFVTMNPDNSALNSEDEIDARADSDAYEFPSQITQEALLAAYFDYVHPIYPILDWQSFYASFQAKRSSLLLLQCVFFMGSHHCEIKHLKRATFSNRAEAISAFYRRAEALYNAEAEPDGLKCLQASFLLQFCWELTQMSKDSWHWLGICIRLAQSMGLHRKSAHHQMPLSIQKVWKRIWWCLFVRYVAFLNIILSNIIQDTRHTDRKRSRKTSHDR